MKTTIAVVGIIVLLIGVGLVAYGASNPVKSITDKTSDISSVVTPLTTRIIDAGGLWSPGAQVLTKGEVITATFTLTNYSSTQGPVFLYVQNLSQFIAWGACAPCTSPSLSNTTLPSNGTYRLTWTVPYNGSFYFSIDDEAYNSSAAAQFSATGNTTVSVPVTIVSQNTTFLDSGAGLIIVGAIVLALGLVATGSKPDEKPQTKPDEKAQL